MYIPKPALQDCLTSEISASGGDVMYDYITGSQIRRVHYFGNTTGSHEFEVYEGCTDSTQLFLVGGGGAGGFGERRTTGSGGPYFLPAPASYISCANTTTQTAGGGGAGGVLLINPNRELTGSLEIVPGKYPIYIGDGGRMTLTTDGSTNVNTDGEDTTFKYAYRIANDADIPSGSASSSRYDYDSTTIKAGGGGAGGNITWQTTINASCGVPFGTPHWQQFTSNAGDGGSGGGASNTFCGDGTLYIGESGSVIFPFRNQGHEGIWYYSPSVASPTVLSGNGGGGYSGSTAIPQGEQTLGGDGLGEYVRGYNQFYGFGGSAQDDYTCGTAGLTEPGDARNLFNIIYESGSQVPFYKGSGGQAHVYDFTSSMTITNQDGYFKGVSGEAIITYALTGSQLTNGKLYYIDGGASGGIFTFVPCGEVRVETLVVPAGKQACICAMDTGLGLYRGGTYRDAWYRETVDLQNPTPSDYEWKPEKMLDQMPSGSGTVTFTTGSSCNAYVPFEGWDTCGSCAQNAPGGIYIGFDISGSSGRTNPLPYYKYPDTTIHYTSSQNNIIAERYNNHDSESYFQTRIGAISNDYDDDTAFSNFEPSASFSTSYQDQNVTFTTGSQCFTYYECDPFDPAPITASGGTEGTFISGSWIYKYHIFESSGSSTEPFGTRSFQELNIAGGYSNDINMLVIGPGGAGAPATGSNNGKVFYGAGGGAGQLKLTRALDICSNYTLHIAPGFAYPTLEGNSPTPDVWQEFYGQTIVSASDASLYISAGMGGRGSAPVQFGGNTAMSDWNDRSGSGGGGAAITSSVSDAYITGGYDTQQTDGGDGYNGTGSAGGGGGAGEVGYDGTGGPTAKGGEGGNGLRLNLDGTLRWYAGGGAGYGPGGAADGGLGGGGTSGIGLSTGSFYGGGGGAWIGPSQGYITDWGDSYILNGRGSDGAVIINYKWKFNTTPDDNIVIRGLSQFYDIYDTNSYDGTGTEVYSLWNDGTASLGNEQGWQYNTTVLDGSGSLEVVTSSLHPYVTTEAESGSSQYSFLVTWFSNNTTYGVDGTYPILAMENFGTSSFGLYAGDDATYGEAVVIRVGDTEVTTISGSAGNFIPRGGFHISQFSYNQGTQELLWYVDGYSGSAVVTEDISTDTILASFNSSSLAIGLGDDSTYNNTAIYTASLTWEEMRHNDDYLYPRY